MNKNRAYNLLKKIGFTRVSGTEEELKAANILLDEIKATGNEGHLESFKVNAHTIHTAKFIVTKPVYKEYEVNGYGHCGSTSKDGITAPFYYMECKDEVSKAKAKGKIVLVNGYLTFELYKAITEAGAVGFVTYSGRVIDKDKDVDLDIKEIRQQQIDAFGKVYGVHMRTKAAMDLIKSKPEEAKIIIQQDEGECDSHNVIAEIEGESKPEEVITFTAHFDSVPYSKGVYDNGAGSVIQMELYHYFLAHKPARTLRFIWCGSEERGLLGSKAYVRDHKDELKDIVLSINTDVGGSVLGNEYAIITADDSLTNYVDYVAKELGYPIEIKQDIYSSDCIPFADNGVPAINFARFGAQGGAFIHSRHDTMFFLDADSLYKTGSFVEVFATKMANAVVFPVPRKIPTNIVEKIDKYLKKEFAKKD